MMAIGHREAMLLRSDWEDGLGPQDKRALGPMLGILALLWAAGFIAASFTENDRTIFVICTAVSGAALMMWGSGPDK